MKDKNYLYNYLTAMNMNKRLLFMLVVLVCSYAAYPLTAWAQDDDYEAQSEATSWYANFCENILLRFEGLRHDTSQLPQKYCTVQHPSAGARKYALVVASWDEKTMAMFTPDGDGVTGKLTDSSVLPEYVYWDHISNLLKYASHKNDITLSKRPLPVRTTNLARNSFIAVVDYEDKVDNIGRYNQMMFKPHVNGVRLVKENRRTKKDEGGNAIIDEIEYHFKLNNPAATAKMFRGYKDGEMVPWIVTNDFFTDHNVLQFSRWKEGEPIKKASADVCRIISQYYGGRRIKDSRWVATVEEAERSFYAVQFEHAGGDALAALVCVAEGEVASVWEFHGGMKPDEYKEGESIWFVDDSGDFMEHIPELQCIVATDAGLELYVRVFGGESVQYYVLREVGQVMMVLQVDYYIWAWE